MRKLELTAAEVFCAFERSLSTGSDDRMALSKVEGVLMFLLSSSKALSQFRLSNAASAATLPYLLSETDKNTEGNCS